MDPSAPADSRLIRWSYSDLALLGMMIDVTVALGDLHFAIVAIAAAVPLGADQADIRESLLSARQRLTDINKTVDAAMEEVRQQHG